MKQTPKVVGSKRLSRPDGVKDIMVPGGHATPERRAQRDFSKNGISTDEPRMADHDERAARYGF
jgi:hypothetical protein